MLKTIQNYLAHLKEYQPADYRRGKALVHQGSCQVLSHSNQYYEVLITTGDDELELNIKMVEGDMIPLTGSKKADWNEYAVAALLQIE
jgi:hypothetical protein